MTNKGNVHLLVFPKEGKFNQMWENAISRVNLVLIKVFKNIVVRTWKSGSGYLIFCYDVLNNFIVYNYINQLWAVARSSF